jgi:hypothetical protein
VKEGVQLVFKFGGDTPAATPVCFVIQGSENCRTVSVPADLSLVPSVNEEGLGLTVYFERSSGNAWDIHWVNGLIAVGGREATCAFHAKTISCDLEALRARQ